MFRHLSVPLVRDDQATRGASGEDGRENQVLQAQEVSHMNEPLSREVSCSNAPRPVEFVVTGRAGISGQLGGEISGSQNAAADTKSEKWPDPVPEYTQSPN